MNANDTQVAGRHYAAKTQHWDYVLLALDGRYLEGNITKYVLRHRKKNGLQDLEKAMHYTDKLIETFRGNRIRGLEGTYLSKFSIREFCLQNELNDYETGVMGMAARWATVADLQSMRSMIDALIEQFKRYSSAADGEKAGAGYVNQG